MKIVNKQAEAIPSRISLHEFGKAMSELDLTSVPNHKKAAAVQDHLASIMSKTIMSPTAAFDIEMSRQMRRRSN
tara:strand:- start:109 stop:330 length:222 start_codon:yes stop_codon:yes gene_type:complete